MDIMDILIITPTIKNLDHIPLSRAGNGNSFYNKLKRLTKAPTSQLQSPSEKKPIRSLREASCCLFYKYAKGRGVYLFVVIGNSSFIFDVRGLVTALFGATQANLFQSTCYWISLGRATTQVLPSRHRQVSFYNPSFTL